MRRRLGLMKKVLLHIDYDAKKDFAVGFVGTVCCCFGGSEKQLGWVENEATR